MAGHLFVFSQQRILGSIAKDKKFLLSTAQMQKMIGLCKDDIVLLAVRDKNKCLKVFITGIASTGIVSLNGKSHYVRLKFVKVRTPETAYELSDGLSDNTSLDKLDWRGLNEQETAACLFNTKKYSQHLSKLKQAIVADLPSGLNINPDAVLSSVLWNVSSKGEGCAFRNWYDANVVSNQDSYSDALRYRLQELDGDNFEKLMQIFFSISFYGFKVRQSQQTRDNGVDLFLSSSSEIHGDIFLAAQCKRQVSPVGIEALQSFKGAMTNPLNVNFGNAKAAKGIFITTSHFSSTATKFANQDGFMHLIDGNELARLFFQHAEQSPGMWKILDKSTPKPVQHSLFQAAKTVPKSPRRSAKSMTQEKNELAQPSPGGADASV